MFHNMIYLPKSKSDFDGIEQKVLEINITLFEKNMINIFKITFNRKLSTLFSNKALKFCEYVIRTHVNGL